MSVGAFTTDNAQVENKRETTFHITARINTNDPEVAQILSLWKNYLHSRPDSLYDNPHWHEDDKRYFPEFDMARPWVFFAPNVFEYFNLTVLSVEREKEGLYVIRTLFLGNREDLGTALPAAIVRVYASKNARGVWKIRSPLPIITEYWEKSSVGPVTFHYPGSHSFDKRLARLTEKFCSDIVERFELREPEDEAIQFYITSSRDELARILGIEYYLRPVHGYTYLGNNIILSGMGSEWYPHELTHILFKDFGEAHFILQEGIATWLGGSLGESLAAMIEKTWQRLQSTPQLTFAEILKDPQGESLAFYTLGGVLCRTAYDKGGPRLLKKLLRYGPTDRDLYAALEDVFNITADDIDDFMVRQLMAYSVLHHDPETAADNQTQR